MKINRIVPFSPVENEKSGLRLLIIFTGCVIFFSLWSGSLYPWDEAWYGEMAREIVVEKLGWLTLHFNHEPFLEKSPLFVWMIAVAFKVFGVNEFSVRIWTALLGFGTVMLLYYLVKELFSSHSIAFFSSLTLLSFHFFTRQARQGMMDVPTTFFMLLGIFLFLMGRKKQWYYVFIGPIFAAAFMIKSFAAVPYLIILVLFIFFAGEKKLLINGFLLSGIIIGMLMSIPWHIQQYLSHGKDFFEIYFMRSILARTTEVLDEHKGNIFYHFKEIAALNKPLGLVSLITFPYFIFIFIKEKDREKRNSFFLVAVSIAVILSLYTIVKTKLPWYVIPAYPFLAVSTVIAVSHMFSRVKYDKKRLVSVALVILLAIPVFQLIDSRKHRILNYRPELKEICLAIKNNSSRDDIVLYYNVSDITTALFYSERKAKIKVSEYKISKFISESEPFILLMLKEDGYYEELKKDTALSVLHENEDYIAFKKV